MHGSLAIARGTLYVGVQEKRAHVRLFDLDGRVLGGFGFRDAEVGRSAVTGLAVDEDRRIWIADRPADRVRRFSLFGRETGALVGASETGGDPSAALLPGLVSAPMDVEVQGNHDAGWLAVACAGERARAVQIFEPDLAWRASLASLGDAQRPFRGVVRIAGQGRNLLVAEAQARRVQVFREAEFLFAFQLSLASGERFEPSALAPLPDGRVIVGCRAPESALLLVDATGRVLRRLASEGEGEGSVLEPTDAVVEPGAEERLTRLFVIDRDGLRVQVFTLDGRCLGSIAPDQPLPERARRTKGEREKKGGR